MRYGVHRILEDEADRLIHESLKDVKSYEAKKDILTPWKLKNRAMRELLTPTGTVEASARQGMFHRKTNATRPDLNSADGIAKHRNRGNSYTQTYRNEYGFAPEDC